jgi:hexosaminidase
MRPLPLLVLASAVLCAGAADFSLLPWPVKVEPGQGAFPLTGQTTIVADSIFTNEVALLLHDLRAATRLPLQQRRNAAEGGGIIRMVKTSRLEGGQEAYRLDVTKEQVTLGAAEPEGMFRATQTLLQLLPAGVASTGGPCELHGVHIEDAPRFQWRGLMLDCSRTFQSIGYLRQTLDRMVCYKLNILHLHLTDDQGWRLEIKRYPELTQQGARFPAKYNEPPSHQGYYTQAQMREVVAYAAARHITIVPEIEMPGHSLEVLACYPRLSCTGGPFEIFPFFKGPGVTENVLCAGNEATFAFLDDVLAEVAVIFPGPYIHIGGDEVPKTAWKACSKCQGRMKAEGLKNESELQSYFIRRVAKLVEKHGKRLIGWDEILEGGLAPNATVMSWRGMEGGMAAARAGHDVVMSPTSHCYFDYTYSAINSARVFAFDPLAGIPPEAACHVLGLQANFWSHIDREPELVDRQLFPRLLALAERGWSPDNRSQWTDYQRRARAQLPRLTQLGIHYQTLDLAAPVGEGSLQKTNSL